MRIQENIDYVKKQRITISKSRDENHENSVPPKSDPRVSKLVLSDVLSRRGSNGNLLNCLKDFREGTGNVIKAKE